MNGRVYPTSVRPLSLLESTKLANALETSEKLKRNFLKPSGLLPKMYYMSTLILTDRGLVHANAKDGFVFCFPIVIIALASALGCSI